VSAAIQVFLRRSNVPTVDDWNAVIKAEGFDLVRYPVLEIEARVESFENGRGLPKGIQAT
jgi:hypothetical protein